MTTDKPTDDDLDSLLARGGLGGAARDRVLENVLAGLPPGAAPKRRPWLARWSLALGTLAAATAAIVLVSSRAVDRGDDLRPKGPAGAGVELDVACPAGSLDACPIGATLVFGVGGQADGFLAAYAEPRDGVGERVWYFSADAEAPPVHAAGGTTPLRRAIRLGAEHVPERYLVHVLLTRAPTTRAALLAGLAPADVVAQRQVELRVTTEPTPEGASRGR